MLCDSSVVVCAERCCQPAVPVADDGRVIAVELLTGYGNLVCELGGEPDSLLREVGIEGSMLHEPGAKVPLRAMALLLENSATALNCPDFGLRLAARQNGPAIMKPLDRLIRNAPTLGDVVRYVCWHMEPYSSGIRLTLEPDREQGLQFLGTDLLFEGHDSCVQIIEQFALLSYSAAISLTGGAARVRQVWFSHPRVGRLSAYSRRFGAIPIKFGQPLDGVFYCPADLARKVVDRDPDIFDSESRLIAARYPARVPGIAVRARQAILRTLAEECCTRESVAASLGMHTRKLQRCLSPLGMSFEGLRDEVRRSLAARYLARKDLCLADIVGRLGYSEPAVLSRSCRRWFAATPSELRRALTGAAK
jgi:AraC-like DNA-binding protein